MIVLAPHSLAHHLLKGDSSHTDDDVTSIQSDDYDSSSSRTCFEAAPIESKTHRRWEVDLEPSSWHDARLKVSAALGSIAAPPLITLFGDEVMEKRSIFMFDHDPTRSSSSSSFHTYLDHITDLAHSHTALLQTINRILEILSDASSICLGVGPRLGGSMGNGRLVARVENAWIARHRPKQNQVESNNDQNRPPNYDPPKLTLQQLRQVLHQAIADHASSLMDILNTCNNIMDISAQQQQSMAEWSVFVNDLQHSLLLPSTILTISQLSRWNNRSGKFLSWILSNLLAQPLVPDCSWIPVILRSLHFARERIVFLHSACPLSMPNNNDLHSCTLDNQNVSVRTTNDTIEYKNEVIDVQSLWKKNRRRQSDTIIANLSDIQEAARVAFWAFRRAYSESTTEEALVNDPAKQCTAQLTDNDSDVEDSESSQLWWSNFKDMIERLRTAISEYDEHSLRSNVTYPDLDEGMESCNFDDTRDLFVANGLGAGGEMYDENLNNYSIVDRPNADKTIVFSGTGTRSRQPPPPLRAQVETSSSLAPRQEKGISPPLSREFNLMDQVLLLKDLEKRIQTMVLNTDYEVSHSDCEDGNKIVNDHTTEGMAGTTSNPIVTQNHQVYTLSGCLLEELQSRIQSNRIWEADDQ